MLTAIYHDLPDGYGTKDAPGELDRYAVVVVPDYNGDEVVITVIANGHPVMTVETEDGAWKLLRSMDDSDGLAQAAAGLMLRIGYSEDEAFPALVADLGWRRALLESSATHPVDQEAMKRFVAALYQQIGRGYVTSGLPAA